jgi:hypothetical protein
VAGGGSGFRSIFLVGVVSGHILLRIGSVCSFWMRWILGFGETPTSVGLSVGFCVGRHCLTMLVAVWGGGLMRRFVMVRCYCGDGLSWRPQLSRFELVT